MNDHIHLVIESKQSTSEQKSETSAFRQVRNIGVRSEQSMKHEDGTGMIRRRWRIFSFSFTLRNRRRQTAEVIALFLSESSSEKIIVMNAISIIGFLLVIQIQRSSTGCLYDGRLFNCESLCDEEAQMVGMVRVMGNILDGRCWNDVVKVC